MELRKTFQFLVIDKMIPRICKSLQSFISPQYVEGILDEIENTFNGTFVV